MQEEILDENQKPETPDTVPGDEDEETPVVHTTTTVGSYTHNSQKEGKTYSKDGVIPFAESNSTRVAMFMDEAISTPAFEEKKE